MTEAEQNGREDGRGLRFLLPRLALRGGVGSRLGSRAGESLEFQDYRDTTRLATISATSTGTSSRGRNAKW